jgi:hypothetical protein
MLNSTKETFTHIRENNLTDKWGNRKLRTEIREIVFKNIYQPTEKEHPFVLNVDVNIFLLLVTAIEV